MSAGYGYRHVRRRAPPRRDGEVGNTSSPGVGIFCAILAGARAVVKRRGRAPAFYHRQCCSDIILPGNREIVPLPERETKARRISMPRNRDDYCTIEEALAELRAGRMIVLVDDENRENEGDLVLPA